MKKELFFTPALWKKDEKKNYFLHQSCGKKMKKELFFAPALFSVLYFFSFFFAKFSTNPLGELGELSFFVSIFGALGFAWIHPSR